LGEGFKRLFVLFLFAEGRFSIYRVLGCSCEDEGLVGVMGEAFPSIEIDGIHAHDAGEVRIFE
jgi:hypothetical protein